MDDTVSIQFRWTIYRPDQREYRQQEMELNPSAFVIVKIPKTDEYFHGYDDPTDQPILTLAGLKYLTDQFDTVFLPKKSEAKADVDDDWETDVSTNRPATSKDGKDDWDDADFDEDKKGTDEKDWEEKEEEWE